MSINGTLKDVPFNVTATYYKWVFFANQFEWLFLPIGEEVSTDLTTTSPEAILSTTQKTESSKGNVVQTTTSTKHVEVISSTVQQTQAPNGNNGQTEMTIKTKTTETTTTTPTNDKTTKSDVVSDIETIKSTIRSTSSASVLKFGLFAFIFCLPTPWLW